MTNATKTSAAYTYTVVTRDVDGTGRKQFKSHAGARKHFEAMAGHSLETALNAMYDDGNGAKVPELAAVSRVRAVSNYGTVVEYSRKAVDGAAAVAAPVVKQEAQEARRAAAIAESAGGKVVAKAKADSRKAPAAARGAKTAELVALFDQIGVEALSLNMARDIAEDAGLNRTSAGITFYRWRAARVAGLDAVPASSVTAAKAFAVAD